MQQPRTPVGICRYLTRGADCSWMSLPQLQRQGTSGKPHRERGGQRAPGLHTAPPGLSSARQYGPSAGHRSGSHRLCCLAECGCICDFCCSSFPLGNVCKAGYFPESETETLTSSRTPPSCQLVPLTHFCLVLRAAPASTPLPLSPLVHLTLAQPQFCLCAHV